jgi:hypothetical protein
MVEDLRRRLCNDGHEDQFPLFRLSARYWLSDETFVGVHKSDDVWRDAPTAVIGQTSLARLPTTLLAMRLAGKLVISTLRLGLG